MDSISHPHIQDKQLEEGRWETIWLTPSCASRIKLPVAVPTCGICVSNGWPIQPCLMELIVSQLLSPWFSLKLDTRVCVSSGRSFSGKRVEHGAWAWMCLPEGHTMVTRQICICVVPSTRLCLKEAVIYAPVLKWFFERKPAGREKTHAWWKADLWWRDQLLCVYELFSPLNLDENDSFDCLCMRPLSVPLWFRHQTKFFCFVLVWFLAGHNIVMDSFRGPVWQWNYVYV